MARKVTFIPAETFTGYPGTRKGVEFVAGQKSIPVSEAFATLMRDKGHVKRGAEFEPVEGSTDQDGSSDDEKAGQANKPKG